MKSCDFPSSEQEVIVDSLCFVPGDDVVIRFRSKSLLRVVFLVPRNLPTEVDCEVNGKVVSPYKTSENA